MKAAKLQVFDPAMCCPTGICGPNVNPDLVRFSADLDWLKQQGVEVERYNLSSHPAAFAQNKVVREALQYEGNKCLPLIVVNDEIVSRCVYPSRSELIAFAGISPEPQALNSASLAAPPYLQDASAACGPGCDCATPSKSSAKALKVVVSAAIILAVGGILVYKATTRQTTANEAVAKSSVFNLGQTATPVQPGAGSQSAGVDKSVMGEYLNSLNVLNQVAMDKDVVFIYLPGEASKLLTGIRTTPCSPPKPLWDAITSTWDCTPWRLDRRIIPTSLRKSRRRPFWSRSKAKVCQRFPEM